MLAGPLFLDQSIVRHASWLKWWKCWKQNPISENSTHLWILLLLNRGALPWPFWTWNLLFDKTSWGVGKEDDTISDSYFQAYDTCVSHNRPTYTYIYMCTTTASLGFPGGAGNPSAMVETWVQSLGWEDSLKKEMITQSSILAWKIPWTEEPGRLQSMGSWKSWTWFSN